MMMPPRHRLVSVCVATAEQRIATRGAIRRAADWLGALIRRAASGVASYTPSSGSSMGADASAAARRSAAAMVVGSPRAAAARFRRCCYASGKSCTASAVRRGCASWTRCRRPWPAASGPAPAPRGHRSGLALVEQRSRVECRAERTGGRRRVPGGGTCAGGAMGRECRPVDQISRCAAGKKEWSPRLVPAALGRPALAVAVRSLPRSSAVQHMALAT